VAVSEDEGVTWTIHDIPGGKFLPYSNILQFGFVNGNYMPVEPIQVDGEGNVYMLWTDENDILSYAVSRDKAKTWSAPIVVSDPSVKHVRYGSIAVKSPGTIAIAYYGTTEELNNNGYYAGEWNGYLAESTNALSDKPEFHSLIVNNPDDPLYPQGMDPGYIGMFIGGDLNEVIHVRYAPSGDIWVSFSKLMCSTQIVSGTTISDICPTCIECKWDIAAHANSSLQGVIGRFVHMK
jgi:hypothetical protein